MAWVSYQNIPTFSNVVIPLLRSKEGEYNKITVRVDVVHTCFRHGKDLKLILGKQLISRDAFWAFFLYVCRY